MYISFVELNRFALSQANIWWRDMCKVRGKLDLHAKASGIVVYDRVLNLRHPAMRNWRVLDMRKMQLK